MKRFQPILLATIVAISTATAAPASHAPKDKAAKEKKYELPKTGVNVPRGSGWLNTAVAGNRFVVTFYDEKKKPIAAAADRGSVRYVYAAKKPEPRCP